MTHDGPFCRTPDECFKTGCKLFKSIEDIVNHDRALRFEDDIDRLRDVAAKLDEGAGWPSCLSEAYYIYTDYSAAAAAFVADLQVVLRRAGREHRD